METNGPEQFDLLLKEALSTYVSSAPRPGLETRILAKARAETYRFRIGLFWPLLACAILALVLCGAAISIHRNKSVPPTEAATKITTSSEVASLAVTPIYPVAIEKKQVHRSPVRKGKQKRFSAPPPLTAQERALLAFAAAAPEETKQALAAWQSSKTEPVRVEPIQIALLNRENQ